MCPCVCVCAHENIHFDLIADLVMAPVHVCVYVHTLYFMRYMCVNVFVRVSASA